MKKAKLYTIAGIHYALVSYGYGQNYIASSPISYTEAIAKTYNLYLSDIIPF